MPCGSPCPIVLERLDLALELHQRHAAERPNLPEPSSACVLFLALCRARKYDEASAMLCYALPATTDAPIAPEPSLLAAI